MLTRRGFLRSGTAALAAFTLPPALAHRARAAGEEPVLVAVFLRGAADGLNLVVPAGDEAYYALRPRIRVPAGDEIPLDGFFGLNPALGHLRALYEAGDLAILHAAGSPHSSRSHFDAQDYMERAAPGDSLVHDGWLNRSLAALGASSSWTGITLGAARTQSLSGDASSLALGSIEDFVLDDASGRSAPLASMYAAARPIPLRRAGSEAFDALEVIGSVETGTLADYPTGSFGGALADAAALLRAQIGVRVIAIDIGGWDHHEGEDQALGPVANELGQGLAAFREDLGTLWPSTCCLVMTEFGRTAAENGSLGTDHGHGSAMFALGGGVAGGRVLLQGGAWPGLASHQLHEERDLAVTTDFRDVFAEVLHRHMGLGLAQLDPVLPGHAISTGAFPGIFG